jgi:hypothetical protein
MSVFNTATGLIAIGMPTCLGFTFGFEKTEIPNENGRIKNSLPCRSESSAGAKPTFA